jgi:hypothetical protein
MQKVHVGGVMKRHHFIMAAIAIVVGIALAANYYLW